MRNKVKKPRPVPTPVEDKSLKKALDEATRGTLGVLFRRHVDASKDAVGALADRWDKNEALYNQDHNESTLNIVDGLKVYPIPLWKQKADRIIGTVFQGITGVEPYVQILTDDGTNDRADDIEKSLQLLAGRGNTKDTFDRAFGQCLTIAVNTNVSILYVYKMAGGRVCFRPIHPKDFVAYPHEMVSLDDMVTIGHRFYRMRSEIQDKIDKGEYFDVPLGSNADPTGEETGKGADFALATGTHHVEIKDELMEMYQLLHKHDFGDGLKWYRFTFAYDSQAILDAELYPYTKPWYFDIRFSDEYNSFWPANSPGWSMQALQKAYTDIVNTIIGGAYACAFPILVFEGGAIPTKMKRSTVGAIYEVPQGTNITQIKPEVDFVWLANMLAIIEKAADGVSRISQLGTAQNLPSGTTATAAAGQLKAQEEGKDQYTSFVAPAIADIWRFLFELLANHFDEFKGNFADALPVETVDDLLQSPVRFEPTGKSAETNPVVLLDKLKMTLGMASNPVSQLDYQKVEDQVVQAFNLPQNIKSLQKDEVSVAQELLRVLLEEGHDPAVVLDTLIKLMPPPETNGSEPPGGATPPETNPNGPVDPGLSIEQGSAGA